MSNPNKITESLNAINNLSTANLLEKYQDKEPEQSSAKENSREEIEDDITIYVDHFEILDKQQLSASIRSILSFENQKTQNIDFDAESSIKKEILDHIGVSNLSSIESLKNSKLYTQHQKVKKSITHLVELNKIFKSCLDYRYTTELVRSDVLKREYGKILLTIEDLIESAEVLLIDLDRFDRIEKYKENKNNVNF